MTQLRIDYANCMADRVGDHGLEPESLRQTVAQLSELTNRLNQTKGTGWERWRSLPFDPIRRDHVKAVKALVRKLREKTDNLIVLGIGGSALGNIALQSALNPPTYTLMPRKERQGPRLFVLDNIDPQLVGKTMKEVRRTDPSLEKTIINVISKSGETAETAAQFLIVRSMLKESLGNEFAEHIVATTDPDEGTLRSLANKEGYWTLPIPEGVGGRFSVLSPVGLFSAAMCGIEIDLLLDGAAEMDERCSNVESMNNPAAILAWLLIEHSKRNKNIHVLMPYCNSLYSLADWFRQLWAESLGKRVDLDGKEIFAGATPVKALGATDQHSQIQLYREGPNDKVVGFLDVECDQDVVISTEPVHENLKYLTGSSLGKLLAAEKKATEYALIESQRPNFTITFPTLDAHTVGQFIQLWMITTAYAGLILNVNAYDQPAVETGKLATFGLMSRPAYEEWKTKVNARLTDTHYLL